MLFLDRSVGGSAANRKVVAADNNLPTIDFGPSEDKIRRRQLLRSLLSSYSARPAILPSSRKESESAICSTRSRIVRRPPSFWRFTRSAPPSSSQKASRRFNSSSSGSQTYSDDPQVGKNRGFVEAWIIS
ncbi:MAG: hypothetical protein CM15mP75_0160 [Flammeovirgaceae bacterium]|nr:MAG: hypothetical protein CM15mP75_0160 [Flammeovirgaceae bacterium]